MSDLIVTDPDVLDGKPFVAGTRPSVDFLSELLAGGATHDEILEAYPELTREGLEASVKYDIEQAWDEEIGRRLASMEAGEELIPWEVVREEVLARLRRDRADAGTKPPPRATYDDLVNAPSDRLAEIIDGQLITSPRRAMREAEAASVLAMLVGSPFGLGLGGPGGWHVLGQPEIHFGDSGALDVVVPDLAGWRVERLPQIPDVAHMRLAPDWICEVLSDASEAIDRIRKMPLYLREGVAHAWLVWPKHRTVEVYRRTDAGWVIVGQYEGAQAVRAEPFEAIELQLGHLWSAPVKQAP